jgi:CO/xanthine dehydrogenase FAD-binding subunit
MKPPAFDYMVATDCDTAVAALARAGGEAKILAGAPNPQYS